MRDRRRLYSDAMVAAARIRATGVAEPALVEVIVHAMRTVKGHEFRRRVWAARLLASLTKDYEVVREAVKRLATAGEWHLRYRALQCLDVDSPRGFTPALSPEYRGEGEILEMRGCGGDL